MTEGITVTFEPGIDQIVSRISSLPPDLIEQVLDDAGEYGVKILREAYPKQKNVTRARAYPDAPYAPGWFSAKQMRWFFANLDNLNIPYNRTGAMGAAWQSSRTGNEVMFTNNSEAAIWTMGEKQSRHEALVGWKKASAIAAGELTFLSSKFRDMVQSAYQKVIRKLQLG
jgi:hypothetical protein